MVDRDHRIPSDAVIQGSPCALSGEAGEDGGATTLSWKKNLSQDDSVDKVREEKPLNANLTQHGDEKGEERERSADLPRKTAGDFPSSSPRLPDGTMNRNHSEEREPNSDGTEGASREKERVKEMSDEESPFRKMAKGSLRGKKIPVGVLKWRKDEEPDEVGKESSEGNGFPLSAALSGEAKDLIEEPPSHPGRLRKAVKWLWIPSLLFGSLLIGLIIGYAGLGGQSPTEVFDLELWKHIYQLIYG